MNPIRKTTIPFRPAQGGVTEFHTFLQVTDIALPFAEQMKHILEAFGTLLTASETASTPIFRRFFLSDAANQQHLLEKALDALPFCATSIVEQPPLDGSKIALWVYSADGLDVEAGVLHHNGYTHYWMGGCRPMSLCGVKDLGTDHYPQGNAEFQMRDIFDAYRSELKPMGMTIARHCLRTWIFVRDVDVNYQGVVVGRRKYFQRIGLTPKTHFIASTGIEGRGATPQVLVQMDALATIGLQSEQVRHLYAKDNLSPTSAYGVTFERGTAVTYGDRCHIFISGTASIDAAGQVMHAGDIRMQTVRTLDNISALLAEAQATLDDIAMAIVYLRDSSDAPVVREMLRQRLPRLNYTMVHAPVCRPAWLIEIECIALRPAGDNRFQPF